MSDTDFLDGLSDGIDKDDLSLLTAKIVLLKQKQAAIDELSEKIRQLEKDALILSREEIPEFLLSKGLQKIVTDSGVTVEVQEKIAVSLPKKDLGKRLNALEWIAKNGGENIIKEELIINKPDEQTQKLLMSKLIPFRIDKDIHYQTLKSFISGKLGLKKGSLPEIEVSDVPEGLNLFIYKETKLS